MRLFFLAFFFLINILYSYGQNLRGFQFIDEDHSHYTIDINSGVLTKGNLKNEIKNLGKMKNWDNLKEDFPKELDIYVHQLKEKRIITLNGTGQVYELDIPSLSIKRIDQTYYRGYNFWANRFIRNDTIFSVGGEGFWQKHSIITFYNTKAREWDVLYTINKNNDHVYAGFSGYSQRHDAFFSVNLNADSVEANKDINFMLFSFKKKLWERKGKFTSQLFSLAKKPHKSAWTGEQLIFYEKDVNDIYILFPFENKFYKIPIDYDRFTALNRIVYYQKGYLYSRDLYPLGKRNDLFLDSISIASLLKKAKNPEQIYEPTPFFYSIDKYYLLVILNLLLFAFIIIFYMFKMLKKKKVMISELEWFIVNIFLETPDKKITSTELNSLLQITHKSYDNQRQIRNRFIGNINQEFFSSLNSKHLILRTANLEDKRMMDYYVNPEVSDKDLKKLAKSFKV